MGYPLLKGFSLAVGYVNTRDDPATPTAPVLPPPPPET